MVIEKIELNDIKVELEEKLSSFDEKLSSVYLANPEVKSFLNDVKIDIKIIYSIFLELKKSYFFDNFYNSNSTNILLFKDFSSNFINNLQILSYRLQVPIHRLINILMDNFLKNESEWINTPGEISLNYNLLKNAISNENLTINVSNKDFVEIMKSDLENTSIKYNFFNIDIVIFKELTVDIFITNIGILNNCKSVFIPKTIPKLLIYSKIKNIGNLQLYDSLDDVYNFILVFK